MGESFKRICFDNDVYKLHITRGNPATDALAVQMHYDPDPIIEYFKEGRGMINIEGKGYSFQEGDVVFITPAELHTSHINDDTPIYRISIHLSQRPFLHCAPSFEHRCGNRYRCILYYDVHDRFAGRVFDEKGKQAVADSV